MPRWHTGLHDVLGKGIMGWPAAVIESDERIRIRWIFDAEAAMKVWRI